MLLGFDWLGLSIISKHLSFQRPCIFILYPPSYTLPSLVSLGRSTCDEVRPTRCGLFHFNFISIIGFWIGSELPKEKIFNSSNNAREAMRPRLIWSVWKFLLLWLSNSHQGQMEKANLQGWAKLWEAVQIDNGNKPVSEKTLQRIECNMQKCQAYSKNHSRKQFNVA